MGNVESVCWGTYCFQPPKFLFQWNLPSRSVFPCNIGLFPLKLAGVAKKTPSLLEWDPINTHYIKCIYWS